MLLMPRKEEDSSEQSAKRQLTRLHCLTNASVWPWVKTITHSTCDVGLFFVFSGHIVKINSLTEPSLAEKQNPSHSKGDGNGYPQTDIWERGERKKKQGVIVIDFV